MIYQGKAITVKALDNGVAELNFNLEGDSVNKFNIATVAELGEAGQALLDTKGVKGLIVTSGKPVFIVGADITEFGELFGGTQDEIVESLSKSNVVFNRLEDLPFPTVTAINGYALGGGLELCLATDFRVMSTAAKIGLPETKLGLYPGFGGTVRLPRVIGIDNAVEWIAGGAEYRADAALKVGAVDAAVAPELLQEATLDLLQQCIDGKIDYKKKRQEKLIPIPLNGTEMIMAFTTCKAIVSQQAGPNYLAPIGAVKSMERSAPLARAEALVVEAKGFSKLVKTTVADAMIGLFLNDQALGKKGKDWAKKTDKVQQGAVLGAGIMGGGIAYQSAFLGTPIIMKDIAQEGIDLGLNEANKLLAKRVNRGRMDPLKMGQVLNSITPTLNYDDFGKVDMVIEAVVENIKVKHAVLTELEDKVSDDTVIASNTSSISITALAEPLKRPENFCGMHFFNPVHAMPLVEVIRGEKTSDATVAKAVSYGMSMGKKVVVVKDCAGFLVNRVLFPYFAGFSLIMKEGADFQKIDKVMERWGWPMGPAYLSDVVGIDTCIHAGSVMADAFPDRLKFDFTSATDVMNNNKRYGQKNSVGFYNYEVDKKGKPKKVATDESYQLLAPHVDASKEFETDEVIERLMLPMCIEMARCLEEGIVETAAECDLSLIYGIGFPPFRGGVLQYMDSIGLKEFCAIADKYSRFGKLYEPTEGMRKMAENGDKYFG